MLLKSEAREAYGYLVLMSDLCKARTEGMRFQLQQEVREALHGNNSPEQLRRIFGAAGKLEKFQQTLLEISNMKKKLGEQISFA